MSSSESKTQWESHVEWESQMLEKNIHASIQDGMASIESIGAYDVEHSKYITPHMVVAFMWFVREVEALISNMQLAIITKQSFNTGLRMDRIRRIQSSYQQKMEKPGKIFRTKPLNTFAENCKYERSMDQVMVLLENYIQLFVLRQNEAWVCYPHSHNYKQLVRDKAAAVVVEENA